MRMQNPMCLVAVTEVVRFQYACPASHVSVRRDPARVVALCENNGRPTEGDMASALGSAERVDPFKQPYAGLTDWYVIATMYHGGGTG